MSERAERERPDRARGLILLALVGLLLAGVFLVSRLADFGLVAGDRFGAGDWKRSDGSLEVRVVPAGGGSARVLGRDSVLRTGDQLELSYGRTRYLYLWVVRVRPGGVVEPLVPRGSADKHPHGRKTANNGEVVSERISLDEPGELVLLGLFAPVPYTLEKIREAAVAVGEEDPAIVAREMYLPSRRFVYVLEVEERP